ncbi:MAG TPA: carbamoyltransferase HypF [Thermoguttaceae bacterium]|nr:carbamoyltransferase HypF [Thermoguttaceae bacterium]
MQHPTAIPPTLHRLAITVRGVVQGVGFRPFVYNLARSGGLVGWVVNRADTVRIEVQGEKASVDRFVESLRTEGPPQARIESIDVEEMPPAVDQPSVFEIRSSDMQSSPRPTIPADLATCADCLQEIRDPAERRYRYPFTNCTNCGPRLSIIRQLPYDRPRTSMAPFAMCEDCRAEYENPADRRFHAQPIACPRCGPVLTLLDAEGNTLAVGEEALARAVEALVTGRILAMKGLGGFQLLADATSTKAIALLRARKRRPDKPLAVMAASLEQVRHYCELSDDESTLLTSPEASIVLLRKANGASRLADGVAPENPTLGVMLPYTPLHYLLTAAVARPIVCTSGNLSEEPMATRTSQAVERLGRIADLLLTHDRPIVRPVDDSVVQMGPEGAQVLRRARGHAPLPVRLAFESPTILAVGGHLKNTVALALGSAGSDGEGTHQTSVVLSPHVGDLDNVLSVEVHRQAIADLVDFFEVTPEVVTCDLHPDYASTRHAETLAAEWDVPLVRVQHHHAHVAACMAEHGLDGPVLGLAWDGTGYGLDGTIWGGEALICEGAKFTRAAHLRTFPLPGADRAVREPRRAAMGLFFEVFGEKIPENDWFDESQQKAILTMLERSVQCPRTSSIGRLFDGVAALCGLPAVTSFEGQAAMALQFAADEDEEESYRLPLAEGTPALVDWEPMVRAVLADRTAGLPIGRISGRFHNALAEASVAIAQHSGCSRVVLSGGCFQNRLLAARVQSRLMQAGMNVYTHRQFPPGDGGIALGQVYIAAKG